MGAMWSPRRSARFSVQVERYTHTPPSQMVKTRSQIKNQSQDMVHSDSSNISKSSPLNNTQVQSPDKPIESMTKKLLQWDILINRYSPKTAIDADDCKLSKTNTCTGMSRNLDSTVNHPATESAVPANKSESQHVPKPVAAGQPTKEAVLNSDELASYGTLKDGITSTQTTPSELMFSMELRPNDGSNAAFECPETSVINDPSKCQSPTKCGILRESVSLPAKLCDQNKIYPNETTSSQTSNCSLKLGNGKWEQSIASENPSTADAKLHQTYGSNLTGETNLINCENSLLAPNEKLTKNITENCPEENLCLTENNEAKFPSDIGISDGSIHSELSDIYLNDSDMDFIAEQCINSADNSFETMNDNNSTTPAIKPDATSIDVSENICNKNEHTADRDDLQIANAKDSTQTDYDSISVTGKKLLTVAAKDKISTLMGSRVPVVVLQRIDSPVPHVASDAKKVPDVAVKESPLNIQRELVVDAASVSHDIITTDEAMQLKEKAIKRKGSVMVIEAEIKRSSKAVTVFPKRKFKAKKPLLVTRQKTPIGTFQVTDITECAPLVHYQKTAAGMFEVSPMLPEEYKMVVEEYQETSIGPFKVTKLNVN